MKIAATRQVVLHEADGTLPAPDGATVAGGLGGIRTGAYLPETALLALDTATEDPVTIPGPVTLRAQSGGRWRHVGTLNGGDTIALTEFSGFQERVYMGADWERLVVVAGGELTGDGAVTATLTGEERL